MFEDLQLNLRIVKFLTISIKSVTLTHNFNPNLNLKKSKVLNV